MLGPAIMIVILVVIIPVSVCMTGAVVAWILGFFLRDDADKRNEGTEYVQLGK